MIHRPPKSVNDRYNKGQNGHQHAKNTRKKLAPAYEKNSQLVVRLPAGLN